MKKIVTIMISIVLMITNINAKQIALVNENGDIFSNGDEVCANKDYYMTNNDSGNLNNVTIIDYDSKQIISSIDTRNERTKITFPNNVEKLTIISNAYLENEILDLENENKIDIFVKDCGYKVITNDYKIPILNFTSSYNGKTLSIINQKQLPEYSITYKFIDDKKFKKLDLIDNKGVIDNIEGNIIQINEKYLKDGKSIINSYEFELNEKTKDYMVRTIKQPNLKNNSKNYFLSKKFLIILFLFVMLLIFNLLYHHACLEYKKEKIRVYTKRQRYRRGKNE